MRRERSGPSFLAIALSGLLVPAMALPAAFAKKKDVEEPPVFSPVTYSEEQISLLEAVNLTLQNDPTILLQEESVRLSQGVAQQEKGSFDLSFKADLDASYVKQELLESTKKREREKRDQAEQRFEDARLDRQAAERGRDVLGDIVDALERNPNQPVSPLIPDDAEDALSIELLVFIALIDAEIDFETDPDKRQDLVNQRQQTIEDAFTTAVESGVPAAIQAEEDALSEWLRLGPVPEDEEIYSGRFNLRLEKPFRSGILFAPFIELTLEGSNFVGKKQSDLDGGKGTEDTHKETVGFTVNLPLGRGRGKAATGAAERAAKIDLEASRSALLHQASSSVFRTAQAYWALRAAQETVGIFEESLERQERLVEITDALIQADELPRAEMARAKARAANTRGSVEGALRSLHQARLSLAQVVGLNVEDEAHAPLAGDGFPPAPDPASFETVNSSNMAREAVDQRFDYRAAVQLRDSRKVLVRAARLNLRPVVDLQLKPFYTARAESSFSEAIDRWVGPSGSLALNLDKPFGNNTQKGQLLQSQANFRISDINLENLARLIKSNVVLSFGSLRLALEQLVRADEAIGYYQQTVDAEIEKFRSGSSTLVDTILTEERLTEAYLQWVSAQQQWATFLSQLRFETGTLITGQPEVSRVDEENLFAVPFL